jgi:hypothetical protein
VDAVFAQVDLSLLGGLQPGRVRPQRVTEFGMEAVDVADADQTRDGEE